MLSSGQRVTVAGSGPGIDGIVFHSPSAAKVVVAVIDRKRGPVLRTVDPDTVTARETSGPSDPALELLVRRSPQPSGGARGGTVAQQGRSGFKRGAAHRATGR